MTPLFFAYSDNLLDTHRFRDAEEAYEHYAEFGDAYQYVRVEDDVPPTFLNQEFEDWATEEARHVASLRRHGWSFGRPSGY